MATAEHIDKYPVAGEAVTELPPLEAVAPEPPNAEQLRAELTALEAGLGGEQAHVDQAYGEAMVSVNDFEDIFTRFQTPLTNFTYRLVGNREQAYDLTQDVFLKAYKALASGTTIQAAALSSWLYRIAANTSTDALRRRRLIKWLPLSLFNEDRGVGAGLPNETSTVFDEQGDGSGNPAADALNTYDGGQYENRVADHEEITTILNRMRPEHRDCLLLYEHDGYSCAEIADYLKISPSAVKMRLMRARERFEALYRESQQRSELPAQSPGSSSRPSLALQARFAVPIRDWVGGNATPFPGHPEDTLK